MICGREDVPLEIHHIFPISKDGKTEIANIIVVCPNCHREINLNPEIREIDFVNYLVQLLEKNSDFRNVKSGGRIRGENNYIADITAEEKINDKWTTLIIETKSYSSFTKDRVNRIVEQLKLYRERFGHSRLILAFPGELSAEAISALHHFNIEIWDLSYISNKFKNEIPNVYHPIIQSRLLMFGAVTKKISPEQQLINELKSCAPGKKDWPEYQQLVGKILQKLFCPPLSNPISQSSDAYGTNIRDFILPNYSEEGFWAFLQKQYAAYYIVVDAKNNLREVKKENILQITNYLKKQGAGLFGIIICRNQENKVLSKQGEKNG